MDDDLRWVREYGRTRSPAAFAAVVARHVDLVYGTCARRLLDPAAAEDAAQATFVALAAKAGSLADGAIVAGSLYRTARLESARLARDAATRRRHEAAAARGRSEVAVDPPPPDDAIDRALGRLRPGDRAAIVLRYWQGLIAIRYHRRVVYGDGARVLANLSAQTGLRFTPDRRAVDVWCLVDADGRRITTELGSIPPTRPAAGAANSGH